MATTVYTKKLTHPAFTTALAWDFARAPGYVQGAVSSLLCWFVGGPIGIVVSCGALEGEFQSEAAGATERAAALGECLSVEVSWHVSFHWPSFLHSSFVSIGGSIGFNVDGGSGCQRLATGP
jgi:hypothetical protein